MDTKILAIGLCFFLAMCSHLGCGSSETTTIIACNDDTRADESISIECEKSGAADSGGSVDAGLGDSEGAPKELCDDHNPCTDDIIVDDSCLHPRAPDGQQCSAFPIMVCNDGQCH